MAEIHGPTREHLIGRAGAMPNARLALLASGAVYPLRSVSFIIRHKLWPIVAFVISIYFALFVGLFLATLSLVLPWLKKVDAWMDGTWFAAVGWLIWIAVTGAILLGSAILIVLVGQVVVSPLLEMLSEKTEAAVLGHHEVPFGWGQLARSVRVAVGDLFWGLLFLIGISLVLLPTGPVAPVLGFCFNALLMSQEFVGLPLARRLVGYRGRWAAVWQNRWVCLGFGATTMVMLFIPGINLALLPLATVGGTLLYCDLKMADRL